MKGLCNLKKERKEKVHSFTQRFAAYLNNFSTANKPSDKFLIEYFTLPPNSITESDTFERIFRSKYAVQETHATLMKGLCTLNK